MLHPGTRRYRQNCRCGAADVAIHAIEGNVIGRRVAVERFASVTAAAPAAIGVQRYDRLAPVVVAVELTRRAVESVARAHENAVCTRVVDNSRARADGVLT